MLEFEFEFGEFSRHFQNSNSPNIREFEYEFELGEFLPTHIMGVQNAFPYSHVSCRLCLVF
jgi:hypothetical protein